MKCLHDKGTYYADGVGVRPKEYHKVCPFCPQPKDSEAVRRTKWCGKPGCEQEADIHAHDCPSQPKALSVEDIAEDILLASVCVNGLSKTKLRHHIKDALRHERERGKNGQ